MQEHTGAGRKGAKKNSQQCLPGFGHLWRWGARGTWRSKAWLFENSKGAGRRDEGYIDADSQNVPERVRTRWAKVDETDVGGEKTPVLRLWGAGLCAGGVLWGWTFLVCFQSAFLLRNANPIPGQRNQGRAASPRKPHWGGGLLLETFLINFLSLGFWSSVINSVPSNPASISSFELSLVFPFINPRIPQSGFFLLSLTFYNDI